MAEAPARSERSELLAEALGQPWYHTIELEPGAVTDGAVDLRETAARLLPGRLDGVRALDVGTFDGFWAFELERRGARVVATDLETFGDSEWPPETRRRLGNDEVAGHSPGERFWLAHSLLGSSVERVESPIYDLSEDVVGGKVDYAVIGALLLHLRDPVRGLEAVHRAMKPGSGILVVEPVDLGLSILRRGKPAAQLRATYSEYDWWVGNVACLASWLVLAGFEQPVRRALFRLKAVKPIRQWFTAMEASVPG